jgi:hypothetical protein
MFHLVISALCLATAAFDYSIGLYGWATVLVILSIWNATLYMRSI